MRLACFLLCAVLCLRAEDWLARARAARAAGDFAGAAAAYRELAASEPANPQWLANLGIMLHMAGHHEEALDALGRALKRDPGLIPAQLFSGLSLLALNRPREALPFLEKVRRADPRGPLPVLALGKAHLALDQPRPANDAFLEATRLDPRNSEAWAGLGSTYRSLSLAARSRFWSLRASRESVRAALHEAADPASRPEMLAAESGLAKDPGNLTLLVRLSRACLALAVTSYREALRLEPGWFDAQLSLAAALEESGLVTEAISAYDRAVELRPAEIAAYVRAAFLRGTQGDTAQALLRLAEALKREPRHAEANALMGDLLVRAGEPEKARPYVEAGLRENPDLAPAHAALAKILAAESHWDAAIAEMQKALPADRDGSYYYVLSQFLRQAGRVGEAQTALDEFRARRSLRR